jgi:lipopolysaccharide export system protein LptA
MKNAVFTLVLSILFVMPGFAQQGERVQYEAESLKGMTREGTPVIKLTGDVLFKQTNTNIYCDSAFLYRQSNTLEAYGHVRVEDFEDSVFITSDKLYYNGNDKMAELRDNVVYTDDSIRLFTDNLDYDMTNKSARYYGGGKIIDGRNTLMSTDGLYDTEAKIMIFQEDVVLSNPDYVLESGELIYNLITKNARTNGYTEITTSDGRKLFAQHGSEFNTAEKTSAFLMGEIVTDSYFIRAGELFYDQLNKYYTATTDVYVYAKKDDVIITGQEARFYEDRGIAEVYGDPVLRKPMEPDTLYLTADTLISIDSDNPDAKRLLAYHNVKIFKEDIQGRADSLAYFVADSVIYFYSDPILWNEGSQISADSINLIISDNTIDRMNTSVNSFIISLDSMENFNQIKGRQMTAFFEGNSIDRVDVEGNGESIYFALDDRGSNKLIGMNNILCSDMKIQFNDNQVNKIVFYTDPDASFIPPHEITEGGKLLKGFAWRVDEKPSRNEVLRLETGEEDNIPGMSEEDPEDDEPVPTISEEEELLLREKYKAAKDRVRLQPE